MGTFLNRSVLGGPAIRRSAAALGAAAGIAVAGTAVATVGLAAPAAAGVAAPATVYSCSTSKPYYTGHALTEKGDTGKRVIQAQCELYWRGFLRSGQVDGDFGDDTYHAVLKFQREFDDVCHGGLSIDGVVGTYTWAALRSACPS